MAAKTSVCWNPILYIVMNPQVFHSSFYSFFCCFVYVVVVVIVISLYFLLFCSIFFCCLFMMYFLLLVVFPFVFCCLFLFVVDVCYFLLLQWINPMFLFFPQISALLFDLLLFLIFWSSESHNSH